MRDDFNPEKQIALSAPDYNFQKTRATGILVGLPRCGATICHAASRAGIVSPCIPILRRKEKRLLRSALSLLAYRIIEMSTSSPGVRHGGWILNTRPIREGGKVLNPSNATTSTPSRPLRLHCAVLITTPTEPIQVLTQPGHPRRQSNDRRLPLFDGQSCSCLSSSGILPPRNPRASGPLSLADHVAS